jgi:7-cyano-7-deazaguanine synthase in queuosine biosynthesis
MFSGGLDSFVAYRFAEVHGYEPFPIWIDLGQPYREKEMVAVSRAPFPVKMMRVDYVESVDGITPEAQVIPARNLLLALIGAKYSPVVWICALESELDKYTKERDKTPEFFHLSSGLFTYVFNVLRPETIVDSPFKSMSKPDIVRWALENGISKEQLLGTSSCYAETSGQCGRCSTCFKRWVAMELNAIDEAYEAQPWKSAYAESTSIKMLAATRAADYSHYHPKRILETATALLSKGVQNQLTLAFVKGELNV